jgi:3-deoxy-D-manno-octulosonate 8-phosphate phosphatase (KDO 8-P phosphatase)
MSKIELLAFDFDGVLTNNKVMVFQDGSEAVICSRSDGLAFDIFKQENICSIIISTEENPVVSARGKKLGIFVLQAIKDKKEALNQYCLKNKINIENVAFIGNDINDLSVMKSVGLSIAVADAHKSVIELANYTLKTAGGDGVAREIAEELFNLKIRK